MSVKKPNFGHLENVLIFYFIVNKSMVEAYKEIFDDSDFAN